MKFIIPSYLAENNILKKIDDFSYAKYVSHTPQTKNEVEITNNVLIYVTKGYKILHTAFEDYHIKAGSVLFLKSGTYVMSEVLDKRYEAFLFFYSDAMLIDFIDKYDVAINEQPKSKQDEVCVLKHTDTFSSVILSFIPYFEESEVNSDILKIKFEELFLKILTSKDNRVFKYYLSKIYNSDAEFKKEVERCYADFTTVKEMTNYFKMNENAFRAKFQKLFAQTPKRWIDSKKLTRAKLLLEKRDKTVTEVAREVGYADLAWFSQRFKREFGISPKECKNNNF